MPNLFKLSKENSVKKLNGKTPQWFKDWHGSEFMEIKLRVTGALWLLGILLIAGLSTFAIILASFLGQGQP